ncbi:unnamed protein product [Discosporangium mesarthrocarpum]
MSPGLAPGASGPHLEPSCSGYSTEPRALSVDITTIIVGVGGNPTVGEVVVEAGDSIRWLCEGCQSGEGVGSGDVLVRVTSPALHKPSLLELSPGEVFETTFESPGKYTYEVYKCAYMGSFAVPGRPSQLKAPPQKTAGKHGLRGAEEKPCTIEDEGRGMAGANPASVEEGAKLNEDSPLCSHHRFTTPIFPEASVGESETAATEGDSGSMTTAEDSITPATEWDCVYDAGDKEEKDVGAGEEVGEDKGLRGAELAGAEAVSEGVECGDAEDGEGWRHEGTESTASVSWGGVMLQASGVGERGPSESTLMAVTSCPPSAPDHRSDNHKRLSPPLPQGSAPVSSQGASETSPPVGTEQEGLVIVVEVINMCTFRPAQIQVPVGTIVKFMARNSGTGAYSSRENELEGRSAVHKLRFRSTLPSPGSSGKPISYCPAVPGLVKVRSNTFPHAGICAVEVVPMHPDLSSNAQQPVRGGSLGKDTGAGSGRGGLGQARQGSGPAANAHGHNFGSEASGGEQGPGGEGEEGSGMPSAVAACGDATAMGDEDSVTEMPTQISGSSCLIRPNRSYAAVVGCSQAEGPHEDGMDGPRCSSSVSMVSFGDGLDSSRANGGPCKNVARGRGNVHEVREPTQDSAGTQADKEGVMERTLCGEEMETKEEEEETGECSSSDLTSEGMEASSSPSSAAGAGLGGVPVPFLGGGSLAGGESGGGPAACCRDFAVSHGVTGVGGHLPPSKLEVESCSLSARRFNLMRERYRRGEGDLLPCGSVVPIFDWCTL